MTQLPRQRLGPSTTLFEPSALLAAVVSTSPDAIIAADACGTIVSWNAAAEQMFGYPAEEAIGQDISRLLPPAVPDESERITDRVRDGEAVEHLETVRHHRDGRRVDILLTVSPLGVGDGTLDGVAVVARDITERNRAADLLSYQASHDPLTGLPNRTALTGQIELALERSRHSHARVGVLFLDVDGLRRINDGWGYAAGDQVLRTVAARLQATVGPGHTVARFAGDDFVVVCDQVSGIDDATKLAERLTREVEVPLTVDGIDLVVTAGIGVAVGEAGDDPDELLRDADVALSEAKRAGRARVGLFDATVRRRAAQVLTTEQDLHRALDRGELRVHYQPIVRLADRQVVAHEALLRWEHPRLGLVSPQDFVPVAEDTGLIVPIGAWVLAQACADLARWHDGTGSGPSVSVNLSMRQLQDPTIVDTVAATIAAAHVAPESVELEVTESILTDDVRAVAEVLTALTDLGVGLAVDDFGTGYSSLATLKHFPINTVKVDRVFVAGLGDDPYDTAIINGVVVMARSLGLSVCAEGVETRSQATRLRALGCTLAQGFHFARPAPVLDLAAPEAS